MLLESASIVLLFNTFGCIFSIDCWFYKGIFRHIFEVFSQLSLNHRKYTIYSSVVLVFKASRCKPKFIQAYRCQCQASRLRDASRAWGRTLGTLKKIEKSSTSWWRGPVVPAESTNSGGTGGGRNVLTVSGGHRHGLCVVTTVVMTLQPKWWNISNLNIYLR